MRLPQKDVICSSCLSSYYPFCFSLSLAYSAINSLRIPGLSGLHKPLPGAFVTGESRSTLQVAQFDSFLARVENRAQFTAVALYLRYRLTKVLRISTPQLLPWKVSGVPSVYLTMDASRLRGH